MKKPNPFMMPAYGERIRVEFLYLTNREIRPTRNLENTEDCFNHVETMLFDPNVSCFTRWALHWVIIQSPVS
jgi:hypothetical protein